MIAVTVTLHPEFSVLSTQRMFNTEMFLWGRPSLYGYDVTPDGTRFLVNAIDRSTPQGKINVVLNWRDELPSAGGHAKAMTTPDASRAEKEGNFSPDGSMVAYASNETGRFEIYTRLLRGSDRRFLVSTGGGYEPRWRADSRELTTYPKTAV